MKHLVLAYSLLIVACQSVTAQRTCATHEYLQQQLQADPLLAQRIAAFKEKKEATITVFGETAPPQTTVIKIPVVVHVLYKDAIQNISDAQIKSQIDALNKDFRRLNADTSNIPAVFKHLAADCQIEFELAKVDPNGKGTSGIRRKQTSILMFGLDDRIKHSGKGGDDAWDADSYLNIWVGNLAGGLLGYTSPLGCEKKIDGVAISPAAFGTTGVVSAPFNKGRTATHEIGHWLGLRHIWGDTYCGDDDIDDTPPQKNATRNCPTGVVVNCDNNPHGTMYNNYMDFTDDACLNLFTLGQRAEMRKLFNPGSARYALLSSKALTGTPTRDPVEPTEEPGTGLPVIAKVYPNPAYTFVTVDAGTNQSLLGKTITLHNHLGQLSMRVLITRSVTQLNVQHLQNGVYFVRVEGEDKVTKIVKVGGGGL
jgi:hypothetical protein